MDRGERQPGHGQGESLRQQLGTVGALQAAVVARPVQELLRVCSTLMCDELAAVLPVQKQPDPSPVVQALRDLAGICPRMCVAESGRAGQHGGAESAAVEHGVRRRVEEVNEGRYRVVGGSEVRLPVAAEPGVLLAARGRLP